MLRDKKGNRWRGLFEKRKEDKIEGGGRRDEGWKVVFWNVAGLGNKDRDFWKGLREWEC